MYKIFHVSIDKHFSALSYPMFIEGQQRVDRNIPVVLELRKQGPDITELNGYNHVFVAVNMLVRVVIDNTNYHKIYDVVNTITPLFSSIPIYKNGIPIICLNPTSVVVRHFGRTDPSEPVIVAAIEGNYSAILAKE